MNSKAPKVSFLILNWNGIAFTRACLKSLLTTNYPKVEIIVLDNGSDADELSVLKKEFGTAAIWLRNKTNVGYAAGMNIAFRKATGSYIVLLNNDMEFSRGWLMPLIRILESHKEVGACQPKIRDITNRREFEYASAAGGFVDIFGYPFARGRIFSDVERDRGQYNYPVRVAWAGIMVIRKSILNGGTLFDPIYFNYGEDMDLCARIYNAGYSIVNVPKSVVYHVGGGTLKRNLRKKMFYHHRNNIIFLLINWPIEYLILIALPRIMLDIVSAIYYLGNGFVDGTIAVGEAYVSLIGMFPEILRHRKTMQRAFNRKNFARMPMHKGSIVFDYYIRKARTYRRIMGDDQQYHFKA